MGDDSKKDRHARAGGSDRGVPKTLIIWLIIIGAMVGLYLFTPPKTEPPREWTINEVIERAEEGVIEKGTIKAEPSGGMNWSEIRGTLKSDGDAASVNFVARGRLTDENLQRLQKSGAFTELPASTLMTDILLSLLPFVLIIGLLYFLFVRQLRMAGRGAMNFGKSRAKMLTRERERVTFKEVAGCEEAKEEVREVVEFLRDPKKFQRIGGRIPKGCLLVGPPGTGKTLLARAIAGEADVPFFSISGSDFVEMFVGVGAARVRDMFEQGRRSAPCIVFIDEIDAVGRQRGAGLGGGNDEREQTLNSLLVEMDGFDAHEGVIIIAATNRPDVLDSALLRPGRFDRQIMIDLPDISGREAILKVHVKKIQMEPAVDLSVVARNTPGFSGADLANLLNEAALLAARYGKKLVDARDIDEARDKIWFGRERKRLLDDEDRKLIAFHEAGHALVQARIDTGHLPLHKVTIIPRGRALGLTTMLPRKDILGETRQQLLNQVCCSMGGRVAEEVALGDISNGAAGDIKQATRIARHMVCDWGMSDLGMVALGENQDHIFLGKEIARNQNYSEATARQIDELIRSIVDSQYQRAREIIQSHREALDRIADALLQHETIEGRHVHEIIEHGAILSEIHRPPSAANQTSDDGGGDKAPEAPKKPRQPPLGSETSPVPA